MVLRYYEDLSVAETADHLGLSVGAVKRYTSDGIRALERVLGPVRTASDHDTVAVTATGGPARSAPPGGDADAIPQHPETPRSAR